MVYFAHLRVAQTENLTCEVSTLLWNEVLWLDVTINVMNFNQTELIISGWSSYLNASYIVFSTYFHASSVSRAQDQR